MIVVDWITLSEYKLSFYSNSSAYPYLNISYAVGFPCKIFQMSQHTLTHILSTMLICFVIFGEELMEIRTGYLLRFLLGSSSSLICWVADNNISDDSFLCLFSVHSPADTDRVCTSLSLVFPTIIIVWSVTILLITSILNQMFIVSVNIAFYLEQRIWSDMYMPSSMAFNAVACSSSYQHPIPNVIQRVYLFYCDYGWCSRRTWVQNLRINLFCFVEMASEKWHSHASVSVSLSYGPCSCKFV